jgi:putative tryptophan/tyrosine transport system substrate-binding protein
MKRREFITLLGGAAVHAPFAVRAQEPRRIYRLGGQIPVGREHAGIVAFFDELRSLGFAEGQNLVVLPNGFNVRYEQLAEQTEALIKAAPDAIISGPDNYTRLLKQKTQTIPLIAMTEDMVAAGLAESLARPGGNITGISLLSPELDGKRQGLLIEAVPGVRMMTAIYDSTVTPARHIDQLQNEARQRGVELSRIGVAKSEDVVPAIDAAKSSGAQALNLLATPLLTVNSRPFLERIVAARVPAMHQWPETAEDGGLLGYGPRFTGVFRQRARMVAKVLRGAKPAEIPVEQPTTFELVINLKTAKAIGHEIPAGLVLRADKLIE